MFFQDPLLLTFTDAELEVRYQKFLGESVLWQRDRNFFNVHAISVLGFLVIVWLDDKKYPRPLHWSIVVYATSLAARGAILYVLPKEKYLNNRTWLTALSRCIATICAAFGSLQYWIPGLSIRGAGTLLLMLFLGTGWHNLSYMSLVDAVGFKNHLWLHSITTLIHIVVLRTKFCTHVLHLDPTNCDYPAIREGKASISQCKTDIAVFVKYMKPLWGVLSFATGYWGMPNAFYTAVDDKVLANDFLLCKATVLGVQLITGYVLPTVLLYRAESRSRSSFLQNVERHQGYFVRAEFESYVWNRFWYVAYMCLLAVGVLCLVSGVVLLLVQLGLQGPRLKALRSLE